MDTITLIKLYFNSDSMSAFTDGTFLKRLTEAFAASAEEENEFSEKNMQILHQPVYWCKEPTIEIVLGFKPDEGLVPFKEKVLKNITEVFKKNLKCELKKERIVFLSRA